MKYDVFISYSSKDQKMVEAICAYLEQRRIRCFVAYRDIPKGVTWAERIVEALDESGMMLVAFTENFNASNEVNREIELACNDKKPILTFRLSDTAFAGAKKYFLQNLNWLDAFPEPEPVFGEMYRNVCGLLGKKPEEPSYIEDGSSDCAADVEDSADGLPDTGDCKKDDDKKDDKKEDESPDSESGNNDVRLPEGTKSVKKNGWILFAVLLLCVVAVLHFAFGGKTDSRQYLSKGTINGHEYVDLGLSVKWATCNVGAIKPEEYGGYYAWGETEEKDYYDWDTYKWCNGSYETMTKYCTNSSYGTVDNKTTLALEDDVAHVKWGGSWRMPTKAEQDELRNNCTWSWTTLNSVNGYKVTSKTNGNSIFLPAAGVRYGTLLDSSGSYGNYWSGSLLGSDNLGAYYLSFYSDRYGWYDNDRYSGRSVRPVSE